MARGGQRKRFKRAPCVSRRAISAGRASAEPTQLHLVQRVGRAALSRACLRCASSSSLAPFQSSFRGPASSFRQRDRARRAGVRQEDQRACAGREEAEPTSGTTRRKMTSPGEHSKRQRYTSALLKQCCCCRRSSRQQQNVPRGGRGKRWREKRGKRGRRKV